MQDLQTKVVNVRSDPYDVYIGRGSDWGNPFSHVNSALVSWVVDSRESAISEYHKYITTERPDLMERLSELRGKTLGCYCKPLACHGDVLAVLAESQESL